MPIGPVGNDRNADDSPLGVKPKGRKPLARDGTLWILTPCLFTLRLTRQFGKTLAPPITFSLHLTLYHADRVMPCNQRVLEHTRIKLTQLAATKRRTSVG